jgi:hypothetical protein
MSPSLSDPKRRRAAPGIRSTGRVARLARALPRPFSHLLVDRTSSGSYGLVELRVVTRALGAAVHWATREPYWQRHERIYDAALNEVRCVDPDIGELFALTSPCLVLTVRGRRAVKERTAACLKAGGASEACRDEAWKWKRTQQPK